jgi:hypothetical protein
MEAAGEAARGETPACGDPVVCGVGFGEPRAVADCDPYTLPPAGVARPPLPEGGRDAAACGRGQNTRRPRAATLFTKEGKEIAAGARFP